MNIIKNVSNFVRENKSIVCASLLYFILSSAWLLSLHYNFLTTGYDLGQYIQMFWNTVHGNGLFTSDLRVRPGNVDGFYFWEHFSPILLAFVPMFYVFPAPETLLIIKTFFVSLSIPMLWFLSRQILDKKVATIVVVSYALNPFLFRALSFDFQEQIVLPFIIFLQFYFYINKNYKWFICTTITGLLINEYSAALSAVALVGLIVTKYSRYGEFFDLKKLKEKDIYIPIILVIISLLYFVTATAIMHQNSETGVIVDEGGNRDSAMGYIKTLVLNPSIMYDKIMNNIDDKISSLNMFLMSSFYIPLLSPIFLFTLVLYTIFGWMVDYPSFYEFGNHHAFYVIPYMYIGFILSLEKLNYRSLFDLDTKNNIFKIAVTASIILFSVQLSYFVEERYIPSFDKHTEELNKIVELVPKEASVLTQNTIYPHIAMRNKAYIRTDETRYNQLLQVKEFIDFEYILIDERSKWSTHVKSVIDSLEETKNIDTYGVYAYSDNIILFKRNYFDNPVISETFKQTYGIDELSFKGIELEDKTIVNPIGSNSKTFWFGPYIFIPPNSYNVTFEIRRDDLDVNQNSSLIMLNIAKNRGENTIVQKELQYSDVGNDWTNVSINFTTSSIVTDLEFRGMYPSKDTNIYLKQITIEEITGEMQI